MMPVTPMDAALLLVGYLRQWAVRLNRASISLSYLIKVFSIKKFVILTLEIWLKSRYNRFEMALFPGLIIRSYHLEPTSYLS